MGPQLFHSEVAGQNLAPLWGQAPRSSRMLPLVPSELDPTGFLLRRVSFSNRLSKFHPLNALIAQCQTGIAWQRIGG